MFSTDSRILTARSSQLDAALDAERRLGEHRAHGEPCRRGLDFVERDRGFAVRMQAGRFLLRRWAAENVEAQVVPHDAGEQSRLGSCCRTLVSDCGSNAAGSIDGHGGIHSGLTPVCLSSTSAMCPPLRPP